MESPGNAQYRRRNVKLSTRNQLPGTVTAVVTGEAMAVVKIALEGGQSLTASITKEAADDLGLTEGRAVTALIKSTEVALAVE
jgi:molybdate transport system regulatory protein